MSLTTAPAQTPAQTPGEAPDEAPAPADAAGRAPAFAVVTRWALTSGAGQDPAALADAVRGGTSFVVDPPEDVAGPFGRAGVVTHDPVAELGRKGTRTLDRATLLAVATVGRLGAPVIGTDEPGAAERTGLVLGTGAGSVASTADFTRDALTGDRPYLVDPARFPNTVMNFAAGQCAIRYGLRGPNATVTAGRATVLAAVRYGARWLALGHADRVIVAATEELSAHRARIEWAVAPGRPPLGEGCAAVVLEPAGSGPALAELVALRTALAPRPERVAPLLADCVRDVLGTLGDEPVVLHAPFDATAGSPERAAVAAHVPGEPEVVDTTATLGDAGALAGMLQLEVAVAALRAHPDRGVALVTCVDAEGVVGALALRAGDAG